MVYAESGRRYEQPDLVFAQELAHRAALAVELAQEHRKQAGQLAAITRVAEVAQQAILAPVPPRIGMVDLCAAYRSAAGEALVGGDLYEVLRVPGGVRMLIGDVRGKGLEAVRLATVVLGFYRTLGVDDVSLAEVARQLDQRLVPFLSSEDFVTALLVEILDDGRVLVVNCGHPPPLLFRNGQVSEIVGPTCPPLGLGSAPTQSSVTLTAGDRLLMFTDGLVEARDAHGRFSDILVVVEPLRRREFRVALDAILARLESQVGPDLGDDLALLAAEYQPR